jgi:HPr kinase/phosphorylase
VAAATASTHGTLLIVGGSGVLLRGRSRSGKSALALELISRGHRLVADDAVDLHRGADGRVHGRCPVPLHGFLAVRGLGVVNVVRMYGETAFAESAPLDLLISLDPPAGAIIRNPLEVLSQTSTILELELEELFLQGHLGHNLAVLVEAACLDRQLRAQGYRAGEDLAGRQRRLIEAQKGAD